jgi:NADPH:quinone reductase
MKALRFNSFGNLSELRLEEVPTPRASTGEVLIQIRAASINPSDAKNVLGKMIGTTLPRTPGRDFAGVIVEGPSDMVGQEVWGCGGDIGFTRDGAHAEYLLLPAAGVRSKPKSLSLEEAAAAGLTFITAYHGLIEIADVRAGEILVVTGATGGVGSSVIQIAKWTGARVIAVDRHPIDSKVKELYRIDYTIDSSAENIVN